MSEDQFKSMNDEQLVNLLNQINDAWRKVQKERLSLPAQRNDKLEKARDYLVGATQCVQQYIEEDRGVELTTTLEYDWALKKKA
jgi:hypothetical protein